MRNTLKPALKFGGFNPLECCRSVVHFVAACCWWRWGARSRDTPQKGHPERLLQHPHTWAKFRMYNQPYISSCMQTTLTSAPPQMQNKHGGIPGRAPVPEHVRSPQTLASTAATLKPFDAIFFSSISHLCLALFSAEASSRRTAQMVTDSYLPPPPLIKCPIWTLVAQTKLEPVTFFTVSNALVWTLNSTWNAR